MTYTVALLAALACSAISIYAADPESGDLDVVKVRPNFYMIAGAGGNIGVQIGSDGVVLVDAGVAAASDRVIAALKKLTSASDPLCDRHQRGSGFRGRQRQARQSRTNNFHQRAGQCGAGQAMTNGGAAAILAHDSILQG